MSVVQQTGTEARVILQIALRRRTTLNPIAFQIHLAHLGEEIARSMRAVSEMRSVYLSAGNGTAAFRTTSKHVRVKCVDSGD